MLDEMQTLKDFLKNVEDEQIRKILKSTEGLGTEATRAAIIDRLFEMGYMEKKRGKIAFQPEITGDWLEALNKCEHASTSTTVESYSKSG